MKFWRALVRIFALVFPVLYFYISREMLLNIVGVIGLVFVLIDGSRLISKRFNNYIFKRFGALFEEREERRLSIFSWYMISCFIVIAFFSKEIAIIALCFVTVGNIISELARELYGKTFLFKNEILEGSFVFLMTCLFIGSVLRLALVGFNFWIVFFGALGAAIVKALPIPLDDTLVVSVLSAAVMTFIGGFV